MSISDEKAITDIWDAFEESGFRWIPSSGDAEPRILGTTNDVRESHLPDRRQLIEDFLSGSINLASFKSDMASMAGSNKLWGFSGPSGGMFFSQLVSAQGPDDTDLEALLRENLVAPGGREEAAEHIDRLVDYVQYCRDNIDNIQDAPQTGRIPYFVSYFWQFQGPDRYPIYYSSMKDAFIDLNLFDETGDRSEDYLTFWDLNEEIRSILEDHTNRSIHLWEIERMCLFYNSRDQLEEDVTIGGSESDESLDRTSPEEIWQITPGDGGKYWSTWQEQGVISIGFGLGHNIDTEGLSEEELASAAASEPRNTGTRMSYRFQNEMEPGHIVVSKRGRIKNDDPDVVYGIGVISGEYRSDPQAEIGHQHFIDVDWVETFGDSGVEVSLQDIGSPIQSYTLDLLGEEEYRTIVSRAANTSGIDESPLIDLISSPTTEQNDNTDIHLERLKTILSPIELSIEIPDALYFEDEAGLRREILASINSGQHVIFTGPPGTGKTKLAKAICEQGVRAIDQVHGYTFTTATSEWTAFDTIGGYVPSRDPDGGDELIFQPRLFLDCFRTDSTGIHNKWLVIDEINRSDIDKAFGQLFSVLSGDTVTLPFERENPVQLVPIDETADEEELLEVARDPDAFPVTSSWRLLATMNTYDKASLYEMSFAFMRRFNFIHIGIPSLESDDGTIRASLLDPEGEDNYATAWLTEREELEDALLLSFKELATIWKVVNDYPRSIGPSIVLDILRYIDAYGVASDPSRLGKALTSAIVGHVYPQLEGLRPDQQRELVEALTEDHETDRGDPDLNLDAELLMRKAEDFFNLPSEDE